MDIVSNIAIISINETVVIQIISFIIFVLIINRIMLRPLDTVMRKRLDYMEGLKQETLDADIEIRRLTEELEAQEAAARSEAIALKREIEDFGSDQAKEIYAGAKKEIMGLKNKAADDVKDQLREAMQHLQAEAEELATGMMEKVLNRRLA